MTWRIIEGECGPAMAAMPEASVDAIVCDPPYGISFMGKAWDGKAIADAAQRDRDTRRSLGPESATRPGRVEPRSSSAYGNAAIIAGPVRGGQDFQAWCEAWATEALRVLKPGGHMLAFGGTRTSHRMVCAIEDAGFEIRDTIAWLYGSGFPKSLDVSKAIDKAAGAEREVVGQRTDGRYAYGHSDAARKALGSVVASESETGFTGALGAITAPATADAERWRGWGTALKPAHEPIVVARKPLSGTVAANVLAHGTGALNVDGCRVGFAGETDEQESKGKNRHADFGIGARENRVFGADPRARGEHGNYDPPGRWPANVVLDEKAAAMLDAQTGTLGVAGNLPDSLGGEPESSKSIFGLGMRGPSVVYGDTGGASRFFYCAKADSDERSAGLAVTSLFTPADAPARNDHPTVKPIDLMRWLVRLVTPPGGLVLDPFAGSGTTGCAAVLEGFDFIGVEREAEYAAIARARLAHWTNGAAEGGR